MSTTQPVTATPTLSSPSSTNTPTDNGISHSSSLLFGFLVTVLTLFALFIMCGTLWHRLVARRRAIDAMLATGEPSTGRALERPRMWDAWVISDKRLPQWVDAKPLAAEECRPADPASKAVEIEPSVSFWRRHILRHIPREIIYLFHRPSPSPLQPNFPNGTEVELPIRGSDIRVSVLISMPHPPFLSQTMEEGTREGLHEIEFGTTNLPYRDSGPT
ncbi:hypothetical protein PAXINDRAFT_171873 [Paxillus involutus ATCC 200175]|uniref:Uncharacterized protein n=1 Tax=Paxillus involutus ATCC 200175 TaxID=664439 RepID=A0A0C9SSG4_PAXIN|nr:hypothetical protein PAXINDRAFT_171873 [Paxillus involutus ATCC 200175]